MQSNPDCCRVSSPQLGAAKTEWNNPVPLSGTYVYRVTAVYPDGRQGYVDVNYVRPEPTNPAALTAMHLWSMPVSAGIAPFYYIIVVNVAWTPVPGAAYYVLWGPGLPTTGRTMEETQVQVSSGSPGVVPLKWGVNTWTVGAFFIPGPVSTAAANFTRGSVNVSEPKKP
jgi:hypothetical protein